MGGWSPSEKIYHLHKRRRWIRNRSYTASAENTVKTPTTKVDFEFCILFLNNLIDLKIIIKYLLIIIYFILFICFFNLFRFILYF